MSRYSPDASPVASLTPRSSVADENSDSSFSDIGGEINIRESFGHTNLAAGFRHDKFSNPNSPAIRFLRNNILIAPPQELTARDVAWQEYIAIVQEEIDASIAGKNNADLTAEEILLSSAESWRDVAIAKIRTIFNIEDAEWEASLRTFIYTNYIYLPKNPQNRITAQYFTQQLLEAAFYITHNVDGTAIIDEESLQNAHLKLQTSFSTAVCIGGGITSLTSFCAKIKFPDSLWEEVKQKLVIELEPFCYQGNQAHLPALLDYIFSGNIGEDQNIFAASVDIQFQDMLRLIETVTTRSSELVVEYAVNEYKRILQDTFHEQLQEYEQLAYRIYNPNLNAEEIAALQEQISQKHDEIIEYPIYNNDLFDRLQNHHYSIVQNLRTTNPTEALEILLQSPLDGPKQFHDTITQYVVNSLEWRDVELDKYGELIDLITIVNTYAAKNSTLPIWLQDEAFEILVASDGLIANNLLQELETAREQYFEYGSVEAELHYEVTLSTCLQNALTNLTEQTGILLPLNAAHQGVLQFNQINLLADLQNIISCGCNYLDITNYIRDNRPEVEVPLKIEGLLFHPEQKYIVDLLTKKNIPIDFESACKRALIVGDHIFLSQNLDKFFNYLLRIGEANEPMPLLLSTHLETLLEAFALIEPPIDLPGIFENILSQSNRFGDEFIIPVFHNIVLQSPNPVSVLNWVGEKFGKEFLINQLALPQNRFIAATLLQSSPTHFKNFANEIVYLSHYPEDREVLGNVIQDLITIYNESNFNEREVAIAALEELLPENPRAVVENPDGIVADNNHEENQHNL